MKNFLRLSNTLINTNHIVKIEHYTNQYYVHTVLHHATIFAGFGGMEPDIIKICEKKNPHDFNIMTNWIDSINKEQ